MTSTYHVNLTDRFRAVYGRSNALGPTLHSESPKRPTRWLRDNTYFEGFPSWLGRFVVDPRCVFVWQINAADNTRTPISCSYPRDENALFPLAPWSPAIASVRSHPKTNVVNVTQQRFGNSKREGRISDKPIYDDGRNDSALVQRRLDCYATLNRNVRSSRRERKPYISLQINKYLKKYTHEPAPLVFNYRSNVVMGFLRGSRIHC